LPDLAEKLKMDVTDLMRQCNRKAPPSKALVKGLARELGITESYLDKLGRGPEGSGLSFHQPAGLAKSWLFTRAAHP
jgi:transcriptional regulator with XRE-family HTH domain